MNPFHSRVGGLTLTLYPGYLKVDWTGTGLTRWFRLDGLSVQAYEDNLNLWYQGRDWYGYCVQNNHYAQNLANQIQAVIAAH